MTLSQQEVAKVAALARLALFDHELATMTSDHPLDAENVFRDDVTSPSLSTAEALQSAPRHDGQYFLVPAVLGESGAA
ncbi:MAG: aspartyl/glutamyl-tRNA amidotransferase subunit C [Planctomycetia bacterium]|nr:aspartyl/glutamyl-tRNA amidotransferase subunit C [Planctomycetia bacterium]